MKKMGGILLLMLFVVVSVSEQTNAKLTVIGTATYSGDGANDSRGVLGVYGNPLPETEKARGDYKLIYDDESGLIWLDFTNGIGMWPTQMKWVAGLNDSKVLTCRFHSGVSVTWEGPWRLPTAVDGPRIWGDDGRTNTAGYNVTTDEMGCLFYRSLGNQGGYDSTGSRLPEGGLKNTGPFNNLQPTTYWTGTEFLDYEGIWCWSFNMRSGILNNMALQKQGFSALAVRPGKVVGTEE